MGLSVLEFTTLGFITLGFSNCRDFRFWGSQILEFLSVSYQRSTIHPYDGTITEIRLF